jgi:hypothetical protein
VELFYIVGGAFAAWAVILAFLGITRHDFPASAGAERIVSAISILLMAGAIGSAIYVAVTHEEEEDHERGEEAALVLPR